MKNIEVLLATASDLDNDNLYFGDLIDQLNDIFKSRGINLNLVEHIDCGELESSPEDLDAKLAGCEMCMVLHSNDINEARKEEFSKAYDEFMQGRNPRKIYVFFKDVAEEDLSESMKDFKRGFVNNFGHFYGVYENVDTLRLQFLLQFELYQNKGFGEKLLTVKNEKVQVYETDVVDLNNVAFARDNEKFKELKAQISELSEKILSIQQKIALDPLNQENFSELTSLAGDKRELEEEYNEHQGFLLDMSLAFTKLATKELNETTRQAMGLFEKGFTDAANKLLDEEKMNVDTENMRKKRANALEILAESKKEYEAQINAFLAKTKTAMAASYLSIEERLKSAYSAYESAIKLAEEIDYNKEELGGIYFDYAALLYTYAKYGKALEYYSKALSILEEVLGKKHPDTAMSFNNIGFVYYKQGENEKALECYSKALSIQEEILGENHPDTATSYNNIGAIYHEQGAYEKALEYYSKALSILEEVLGENHPNTLATYKSISSLYNKQMNGYFEEEDYLKAGECCEKIIVLNKRFWGESSFVLIRNYNDLAFLYYKQDRFDESEKCFVFVIENMNSMLVQDELNADDYNSNIASSYAYLGVIYRKRAVYDMSEKYSIKALEIQESLYTSDSDNVEYKNALCSTCRDLAKLYEEMGNTEKREFYKQKSDALDEIEESN